MALRIVFMGTPEFACPSLDILLKHGYQIPSVVTALDKPRGRGQHVTFTPVKEFALMHGLTIMQPESLRDPQFIDKLQSLSPDLIVVVAFRILPPEVIRIPPLGTINLHASLLPKYRGAAPINWAIINGEKETGVTTFFIRETVDTGAIILQERVPIGEDETAGELHDRLSIIGASLVLKTVQLIEKGQVVPCPQDERYATKAPKIFKADCLIRWNAPAPVIHNFIRGLSPSPTAWTTHNGKILRIFRSRLILDSTSHPGVVVRCNPTELVIGTSSGSISILEIQQEGKRRLGIEEFLRGYRIREGELFGDEIAGRFL
ncbi:MAG: methionyl-tRNA formyltransferase [Bacteroidetes bacterium]|nr:methionyl-tRNA formyltransferase [Bacteroidota bacterium]